MRGPNRSVNIPIMTRAGMVSATLRINKVLTWSLLRLSVSPIADKNGAWLNHTKKVRKNAIQPKWRILFLPEKDKIFSLSLVGAMGVDDDIGSFLKRLTSRLLQGVRCTKNNNLRHPRGCNGYASCFCSQCYKTKAYPVINNTAPYIRGFQEVLEKD